MIPRFLISESTAGEEAKPSAVEDKEEARGEGMDVGKLYYTKGDPDLLALLVLWEVNDGASRFELVQGMTEGSI